MGRAKLAMKFREQSRARISTYKTRIKGLKKKAKELSVLCGVDVLFTSFSSDLNHLDCWPANSSDFHRILARYRSLPSSLPSPPLNSSFEEELAAINNKLGEVRQRISFLEAEKTMASSSCEDQRSMKEKDCCDVDDDQDDIYSKLEDLGEDLILKCDWNVISSENFYDSVAMCSDLGDFFEFSADR